jgi:hypothetical protein
MRVPMSDLISGSPGILAGAPNGRKAFAQLLERTAAEPQHPTPLFLDFADMNIATGSFLREGVLTFRDAIRGRPSNFYPVIANANAAIIDELRIVLAPRRDVLLVCSLDAEGNAHDVHLEGRLESKQQITFDLVNAHGEATARDLMQLHHEDEDVTQTAWNNRLASLAGAGLIVELSEGRAKRYRPVLTGN